MQQFPTAAHLASWAGICPGNHESAGKRFSGKTRKGNPWLRCLLVQAAHSASHQKQCYLAEQYRRIAKRRGAKRAAVAVAHSILVIIYHLLKNQTTYQEKGETFFEEQERQGTEKRLVRQLSRLGYQVELQPWLRRGNLLSEPGGGDFFRRVVQREDQAFPVLRKDSIMQKQGDVDVSTACDLLCGNSRTRRELGH